MALQQYLRSNLAVASSIPSPVNPFDPKPWERTFRAGRSDVILLQVLGQSAAFAAHCPQLAAGSSAICPGGSDQGPRWLDLALIRPWPMIQLYIQSQHPLQPYSRLVLSLAAARSGPATADFFLRAADHTLIWTPIVVL